MEKLNYQPVRNVNEVVINWHITESCNYSCHYCYSSWRHSEQTNEVFKNAGFSLRILRELYKFFHSGNQANPLQKALRWQETRLSLAGGEPLLFPHRTGQLVQEAKALGFNVSLITNGSNLCRATLPVLAENLSMLGVSLDSKDPKTNRGIGRADRFSQTMCINELVEILELARSINPELKIKINTVVNALNANEDLSDMIESLQPDKWKVLRALPLVSTELAVTDAQFRIYVERYQHLGSILSVEDNQDMTESYLMVDPFGRFFQNQTNAFSECPYLYSQPILDIGVERAFSQVPFDAKKFALRYESRETETAI